jgi:hypothetical protein
MTMLIDSIHFKKLSEQDPVDVCRRASCTYDDANLCYALRVWGDAYRIFPHQHKIDCIRDRTPILPDYFHLVMVHFLLGAKDIEPRCEWISEKDIPGGTTFFRGPHEIPTKLISTRFKNNLKGFSKACAQLKGVPLKMADAAFTFEMTSRIPVAILYWVGDEDFPAESKILYDRTITAHLASDVIYALSVGICQRLADFPEK